VGCRACYADSLKAWLDVFPEKNFKFIQSEEYFADPQKVLDSIFTWLHVSERHYEEKELHAEGRRRNNVKLPQSLKQEYNNHELVADCHKRLEAMTHRSWSFGG